MKLLALLAGLLAGVAAAQSTPWYFVATALGDGGESAFSNEASKVLGPGDSATLRFTPPTQNSNGSPLTNLRGYRFYYGAVQGFYPSSVTVYDPSLTQYTLANVAGPAPTPALGNPTQAPTFTYTVEPTSPPVAIDATADLVFWSSQFNYTSWIRGTGITALCFELQGGARFDNMRLADGTSVPTTPVLGVNNDSQSHSAPCLTSFTLPLNTNGDVDGTITGVSVRINGTAYPLNRLSGSSTQFPWAFSRRVVQ